MLNWWRGVGSKDDRKGVRGEFQGRVAQATVPKSPGRKDSTTEARAANFFSSSYHRGFPCPEYPGGRVSQTHRVLDRGAKDMATKKKAAKKIVRSHKKAAKKTAKRSLKKAPAKKAAGKKTAKK